MSAFGRAGSHFDSVRLAVLSPVVVTAMPKAQVVDPDPAGDEVERVLGAVLHPAVWLGT